VEVLKLSNSLQNRKCTLSIISFFEIPQTSHPYNKIGFIILSNKSNWHRNFMWLKYVKHILCNCGFNYIWESQTFINELWLKHSIKQNLTDQYLQAWLSSVNDSPKALNYRIYIDNLVFENYLNILNDKDNLTLSKFRTTNHKLPVENGRWKNIARENRICPLCNNGEIGDEFHYLFKCQYFSNQRKIYIKKNIRINPNIIKFKLLMTSTSKIELQKLCRFVRIINKGVSTPG
jgi:hypothetical protein